MSGNDYDNQAGKYCKLFIGGLNYETTEDTIKQYFGKWGEIVDCVIMKTPGTKVSRGFGFITYKTAEMLDDAQNNRPHKMDNRELDTKRAIPLSESNESRSSVKKMFVGGLKDDITEDDIREVFSRFGKIEKLETLKDKFTGKRKGFCFITFDDFDSVDKCVLRQRISVGDKYVEVKKAVPKDVGTRDGRGGFGGANNNGNGYRGNMGYPGNMEGKGYQGYGGGNQGYQGYYSGNWGPQGYGGGNHGHQSYGSGNQGYQGYDGGTQGHQAYGNGSQGYQDYGNENQVGNDSSRHPVWGNQAPQVYSAGNQSGNVSGGPQGYSTGNQVPQGYGSGNQDGNGSSFPHAYHSGNQGGYSSVNANFGGVGGLSACSASDLNDVNNSGSGYGVGPARGANFAPKGAGPYGNGYGRGGYR